MSWLRDPVFVALLNGTVGGALGYLLGRGWRRRTETCQENCEPIFGRGFGHLHECVREHGHRSRVHRCHCGMEWWLPASTDGVAPPAGDEINK